VISEPELRERLARLRDGLPASGTAWVSRRQYVKYLTGCLPATADPAVLVVAADLAVAIWPEAAPAAAPAWFASSSYDPWGEGEDGVAAALKAAVREHGLGSRPVLVDEDAVSVALASCDVRPAAGLFAALVREKSAAEVELIAANLAGNDAAFARIAAELGPGAIDLDVLAWSMDEICRQAGEPVRYEGNIGLGPAGADPGAQPAGIAAKRGDVLFVDLYPMRDGYGGDSTRAFAVAEAPEWAAASHARLVRAIEAAEEAMRPGVPAGEIDRVCRAAAAADGGDAFPHHVGHGLGVFGQEPPYLVPGNRDPLRAGDVVAVEPGVYRPGIGGLRLEDVYEITKTGARRLTAAPRELRSCG
jgi:Xaa-Pro aminopeptidase